MRSQLCLNWIVYVSSILFILLLLGDVPGYAQVPVDSATADFAQTMATDSTSKSSTDDLIIVDPGFNQRTLIRLVKHAGEIGIITLGVLALGIFLIVRQALKLRSDANDSHWVLERIQKVKIDHFDKLEDLEKLISELQGAHNIWEISESKKLKTLLKPTLDGIKNFFNNITGIFSKHEKDDKTKESFVKTTVFALFAKLYEVYKATRDTDNFNEELSTYSQQLKDKFNPFLTRLSYLSDTAGALGLLGTVWGMFLTFFSGSMEQKEIIQGMGIALATTIIGIVVSLILNTFTTIISNRFDKHLIMISKMANDFQVRLMRLGIQPVGASIPIQQPVPQIIYTQPEPKAEPVKVPESPPERKEKEPPRPKRRIPEKIELLSKQHQQSKVNTELPEPLMIQVLDQDGIGMDGVTVTFKLDGDGGSLNGGLKEEYVQTEGGGIAKTVWKLGQSAGKKTVKVIVDGLEAKTTRFFADALPEEPNALLEVSGNFQVGHPAEELARPFVVRVEDKLQNPIPGVFVTFKIKEGDGQFRNSRGKECYIETNEEGIAAIHFKLGNERGNVKVVCTAKNLNSSCTFQAFAQ